MLKLMLHYFSHLMGITNSLEKILVLERIAGKKRRWEQRMGWLDSIINWMDMNFRKHDSGGQRSLMGCHLWCYTELDMTEAT